MFPSQPLFEPKYLNLEYLFYKILELFRVIAEFFGANFQDLYLWLKVLASLAAISFIVMGIYAYIRVKELKEKEHQKLKAVMPRAPARTEKNSRWEEVLRHINSNNPSDWRLAIIEADAILDEMVVRMRYEGENLGERLRKIEPSDFLTLNEAWEAHKVRNRIAHEGSAFSLDHKEAKRVVDLYEKVFREFKYI